MLLDEKARNAFVLAYRGEAGFDTGFNETALSAGFTAYLSTLSHDYEGLEEALRLAEVGEYLYNACAYSYGDGYTEPREYGIEWQWQQSKPDEYGQGQLLAASTRWHANQSDDGTITATSKLRSTITALAAKNAAVSAELEATRALIARLRQEVQIHAMEARGANATIAEAYQAVTKATGEPGNWNGAKPIKDELWSLRSALAAERAAHAETKKALEQAEQQLDYGQVAAAYQIIIRAVRAYEGGGDGQ